jgi:hypothetical protein
MNLSAIVLDLLAALALVGFLLVIAFYTLAALTGAGEANEGEKAQPTPRAEAATGANSATVAPAQPAPAPRQEGRP